MATLFKLSGTDNHYPFNLVYHYQGTCNTSFVSSRNVKELCQHTNQFGHGDFSNLLEIACEIKKISKNRINRVTNWNISLQVIQQLMIFTEDHFTLNFSRGSSKAISFMETYKYSLPVHFVLRELWNWSKWFRNPVLMPGNIWNLKPSIIIYQINELRLL